MLNTTSAPRQNYGPQLMDILDSCSNGQGRIESQMHLLSFAFLRKVHDAEDAVQGMFEVLLRRGLKKYVPSLKPKKWVMAGMANYCRDVLRTRVRRGKRRPYETYGLHDFMDNIPKKDSEETTKRMEVKEGVRNAVASLPPIYRRAIVRRHFWYQCYDEIAEREKIPTGTVKSRLHKGLTLLRRALQNYHQP